MSEAAGSLRSKLSHLLTEFEVGEFDAALAAERKATVERIRAAVMASRLRHGPDDDGGFWPYSSVVAILDAEAER